MAETQTPNLKWTKPDLGGDAATWGNVLNTTIDAIDSVVYANQNGIVPVGSLTMWAGPTAAPPANWLICDGSTLDYGVTPAYQGLFNVIGRAFNATLTGTQFALPNLATRFPYGANPASPLGIAGGFASITLDATMIPAHTHAASQPAHGHAATQAAHAHVIATGNHSHNVLAHAHGSNLVKQGAGSAGLYPGGGFSIAGAGNTDTAGSSTDTAGNLGGNTDAQAPAITVPAAQPAITVANAGGGLSHNNMPPWLAINFIIRYM